MIRKLIRKAQAEYWEFKTHGGRFAEGKNPHRDNDNASGEKDE